MNSPNDVKIANRAQGSGRFEDEIDIRYVLAILLDNRWIIAASAVVGILIATFYLWTANPVYRADVLLQIEKNQGGLPAIAGMENFFSGGKRGGYGASDAEIEIFKSRKIIGAALEKLELDVIARPKYFPVIGGRMAASYRPSDADHENATESYPLAKPFMGLNKYAWGGEKIDIFRLEVPEHLEGVPLTLRHLGDGSYAIFRGEEDKLLEGKVGEQAVGSGVSLIVKELRGHTGTEFLVMKRDKFRAVRSYQARIKVEEQGRMSGILEASLLSTNPGQAKAILDAVSTEYVLQNVQRLSAEAQKSLDFLRQQLPQIKKDLEAAETALSEYRSSSSSVDIGIETKSLLDQLVKIENSISEVELRKAELDQRYTAEHPTYMSLITQLEQLKETRSKLENQISTLPDVQQRLLQLVRDVEVKTKLYTQLLARTQELDVVRAGTIGSVVIIDEAAVDDSAPVSPKRSGVMMFGLILGLAGGLAIAFLRVILRRGVESPDQIEALGIPVFAAIPFSQEQSKVAKALARKESTQFNLLANDSPTDLSIEALRSLRTSLHFAFVGTDKKVIALTGPSPGVGKSFVSINLACLLAQAGQKVAVVDADMRKGTLHRYVGMRPDVGLSSVLSGQCALDQAITTVSGVDLLPRGQVPPNPSELLMGESFGKLIDDLSKRYDHVLIDTPPVLAVADALVVCGLVKTTLLVVRHGMNTVSEVKLSLSRLEQGGVDVKGAVLNGVVKTAGSYYYQNAYYHYEYK
jgi:tyrosine-protein kinase Etk/Wzc